MIVLSLRREIRVLQQTGIRRAYFSTISSNHITSYQGKLFYDDSNAFGIQLWYRQDKIMHLNDVRLVGLIEFEIGPAGTEEGGQQEVNLRSGEAVCSCLLESTLLMEEIWLPKEKTYFMPKQLREPLQNGTRFLFIRGLMSPSHRSGLNLKGSGNISGSVCMKYADIPTGTYILFS